MGLISKLIQTGNIIKRLHNIGSIDGDAYNQLMQDNEETLAILHEKACAKAEPRAKKKALRLFGVVSWLLIYTGFFMMLSAIIYGVGGNNELWFDRLFLSVVSLGLGGILNRL